MTVQDRLSPPAILHVGAPARLWLLALPVEPVDGDLALLSDAERERCAKFRFPHLRAGYAAAHATLRRLLAAHIGDRPERLRFETNAWGKPMLPDAPTLGFSLSYARTAALIGLSDDKPIFGVDIEEMRVIEDVIDLAQDCLSAEEHGDLTSAPSNMRDQLFLQGWTRKEACLKAVGRGLSLDPRSVATGVSTESATLDCAGISLRVDGTHVGRHVLAWAASTTV